MRKSAETFNEEKERVRRRVTRGRYAKTTIRDEKDLAVFEREVAMELACHYKAASLTYKQIAERLQLTENIVKKWFQDQAMQEKSAKLVQDMIGNTIRFGQTQAFDMLEIIAEVARTSDDDKTAVQAACEYLDRVGLTKINKSESKSAAVVREEHEVTLTDKTGLLEALQESAPPEVVSRAAELVDELFSLGSEHIPGGVPHGE